MICEECVGLDISIVVSMRIVSLENGRGERNGRHVRMLVRWIKRLEYNISIQSDVENVARRTEGKLLQWISSE